MSRLTSAVELILDIVAKGNARLDGRERMLLGLSPYVELFQRSSRDGPADG
jgi:hypothetical protein